MATLGGNNKTIVSETLSKIKELITEEKVVKGFIDIITDKELVKRSSALAILWEGILKQENDLKRIKPDVEHFGEDEKIISSVYSKGQMEALKKAKERLDKMIKAFEKGLKGDMADVYNINQTLGKSDGFAAGKDKGGSGTKDSGETS